MALSGSERIKRILSEFGGKARSTLKGLAETNPSDTWQEILAKAEDSLGIDVVEELKEADELRGGATDSGEPKRGKSTKRGKASPKPKRVNKRFLAGQAGARGAKALADVPKSQISRGPFAAMDRLLLGKNKEAKGIVDSVSAQLDDYLDTVIDEGARNKFKIGAAGQKKFSQNIMQTLRTIETDLGKQLGRKLAAPERLALYEVAVLGEARAFAGPDALNKEGIKALESASKKVKSEIGDVLPNAKSKPPGLLSKAGALAKRHPGATGAIGALVLDNYVGGLLKKRGAVKRAKAGLKAPSADTIEQDIRLREALASRAASLSLNNPAVAESLLGIVGEQAPQVPGQVTYGGSGGAAGVQPGADPSVLDDLFGGAF